LQGNHFFQNLTVFNIGYFTINTDGKGSFLDWDWLDAQPDLTHEAHVRHLQLEEPVLVKMNGRGRGGVTSGRFKRVRESRYG
jgi:hypothetical protein